MGIFILDKVKQVGVGNKKQSIFNASKLCFFSSTKIINFFIGHEFRKFVVHYSYVSFFSGGTCLHARMLWEMSASNPLK
jgi:hypothetical protein